MAKVQYTKVEDILIEGLRKFKTDNLLNLANIAAQIGPKKKDTKKILEQLKAELQFFKKKDPSLLKKLTDNPKEIKKILEDSTSLTEEELNLINSFIEKFTEYKLSLKLAATEETNESIIEQERIKHINKRFNVRDKWLPLH